MGEHVNAPSDGRRRPPVGDRADDYTLNTIFQKSLSAKTTLRLNAGVIITGEATTGVVGTKNKGSAFTGGSSIVRQLTKRLRLGLEVASVATGDPHIGSQQTRPSYCARVQPNNADDGEGGRQL